MSRSSWRSDIVTSCVSGIETAEGKAEYVAAQRGFTVRGNALRRRLLDVIAALEPVG